MPRKHRYQWDESAGSHGQPEDQPVRKSRSQKKRESSALQDLGAKLAKLPLRALEGFPLPPDLLEAFRDLKAIKSNEARRRHFQYIGRLMREAENPEAIEEAYVRHVDQLGG